MGLEGVGACVRPYLGVPLGAPVSTRVSASVCTRIGGGRMRLTALVADWPRSGQISPVSPLPRAAPASWVWGMPGGDLSLGPLTPRGGLSHSSCQGARLIFQEGPCVAWEMALASGLSHPAVWPQGSQRVTVFWVVVAGVA